ncbi:hypothetical protein H072_1787 [Dactylellina haptotyla CBS 200.50]|uniref:MYND-type domain-containing protein n=1 Tax=Dactylellina haptotyla (strain CBS 200.50) TaxID=1284197 RepID=S8BXH3_DACHA|nr:hypothetical protein H072_1787 [Dactylellina haptotyla CBS 200.50]
MAKDRPPYVPSPFNRPDYRPSILICAFASGTEAKVVELRHGDFLELIQTSFFTAVAKSPTAAADYMRRKSPNVILAIDSAFAKPEYRWFQDHVARNTKAGAALIMCCEFPRTVSTLDFKTMILNAFNLGWEPGLVYQGTYNLHNTGGLLAGIEQATGVEAELKMTAVQVLDVEDKSRLYINREFDEGEGKGKDAAAAICEKYEKGYLCFIGDLNTSPIMRNIMINIIAKVNMRSSNHIRRHSNQQQPKNQFHDFSSSSPIPAPKMKWARNTTPLNPRGPCENCGKAVTTRTCHSCQTVFFCNGECQNIGLKKHTPICPANSVTLSRAIKLALQGNPTPLVKELIFKQDRREALERLIDAYRLRIEELNRVSGIKVGCYINPDSTELNTDEFINFLRNMHGSRQVARPEWWDLAAQTDCEDLARNHIMRFYIGAPATDREIANHYENPEMPAALRALADIIYGAKVPERRVSPDHRGNENFEQMENASQQELGPGGASGAESSSETNSDKITYRIYS